MERNREKMRKSRQRALNQSQNMEDLDVSLASDMSVEMKGKSTVRKDYR